MTDGILEGRPPKRAGPARRNSARSFYALAVQAAVILLFACLIFYVSHNIAINVTRLNVRTGFDFLSRPAGFEIAQHLIPYQSQASSYLDAFEVALVNTIVVAVTAILLTTPLGFALGLARLSSNRLLALVSRCFVDFVRNVPFLLQLFFWYFSVLGPLPPPRQSFNLLNVIFANRRGLYVPMPETTSNSILFAGALALGLGFWLLSRLAPRGSRLQSAPAAIIAAALLPAIGVWVVFGTPIAFDIPSLQGFNFGGGMMLNPEFVAMILALATYNAAFIAELVRGGVLSVPKGQIEAGSSLGLTKRQINFRIVLPLALRVIVPPLGSQYIQLLKASSLGSAIAYPDLMLVFAGTALTQTNQPIEIMFMTMATYLLLCLVIAGATNIINKRVQLVER